MCSLIIGVDGGGTHTQLVAVNETGQVLGYGKGDGINYNAVGMPVARKRLRDAVDSLLAKLAVSDYDALCVGSSALDNRADAQLTKEFAGDLFDSGKLLMDSDVYVALMGARLGKPGVMTISGTGSMVVGTDEKGDVYVAGGWGYKLDEPGGAYGIALEGIKAAFMDADGIGSSTTITAAALDFFHASDVRGLIPVLYDEKCEPADIAKFARIIIERAEDGDIIAQDICKSQMDILAKTTAAILKKCPPYVCLYGGMFGKSNYIRGIYSNALLKISPNAQFCDIQLPPEFGAVIMYMLEKGILTDDATMAMKAYCDQKN